MDKNTCNLYVIIVTFNAMKWIDQCIESVFYSTIKAKIIVIDNHSEDNTVQYIKATYPEVILLEQNVNLGFGAANNIGIDYALNNNSDYIYLLNQDAWVDKDVFQFLIDAFKDDENWGILSPIQMNKYENALDPNFRWNLEQTESILDLLTKNKKNIFEVDFVMAAHWMISAECIKDVGLFSPIFSHYGEDNNYIDRIKYHGYKVGICSNAFAVHDRFYRTDSKSLMMYKSYVKFLIDSSNICKSLNSKILRYVDFILRQLLQVFKMKSFFPIFYIIKSLFIIKDIRFYNKIFKQKNSITLINSNKL